MSKTAKAALITVAVVLVFIAAIVFLNTPA